MEINTGLNVPEYINNVESLQSNIRMWEHQKSDFEYDPDDVGAEAYISISIDRCYRELREYIAEIRAMMSKVLIEAEADLRAEVAFGTMGGERYRSRVVRYVHNDIAQFENYVKDIVV